MKLLKNSNQLLELEFSADELNLFDRVIAVPLLAFGLDQLVEKTKLNIDKIRLIKQKINVLLEKNLSFYLLVIQSLLVLKKYLKLLVI